MACRCCRMGHYLRVLSRGDLEGGLPPPPARPRLTISELRNAGSLNPNRQRAGGDLDPKFQNK